MYPDFTLLAQQPEKDKLKNSTTIPLQPPGKLHCLVEEPQEVIIAILQVFIWGFVWVGYFNGFCDVLVGGSWHGQPRVQPLIFPLTGSDECAGTHRLLFRCPPVRVALDVFPWMCFFCFGLLNNILGGFLKWWVSPTNPWVFPTKNDDFGVFLGVPPFSETPIYRFWRSFKTYIDI